MIVHGQVHGGVAQGLGQVLSEVIVCGTEDQLLTGSFMDYAVPRAADQPALVVDFHEVPCPDESARRERRRRSRNVRRLTGCDERDRRCARGKRIDFDMPATSEKLWRALNG